MIATYSLRCDVSLSEVDFRRAFSRLTAEATYIPAVFSAKQAIVTSAGLDQNDFALMPTYTIDDFSSFDDEPAGRLGELFFADDETYFLIATVGKWVEVGMVSSLMNSQQSTSKLHAFAEGFKQAATDSMDGRKARHLPFNWAPVAPTTRKFDEIHKKQTTASGSAIFELARLTSEEITGANALTERGARSAALAIAKAGYARETDMLKTHNAQEQDEVRESIGSLKQAKLISTNFLLECRKNRNQLARFEDRGKLTEAAFMRCPTCNSLFSEEAVLEVYSLSDFGKRLTQKSHWMTIWVTECLVNSGVSIDRILWNLSENGEEIDIVLDVLGSLWIIELKDREFGSGDAHPLNYRKVRFESSDAIIITTDIVSPDARRVFAAFSCCVTKEERIAQVLGGNRQDKVRIGQSYRSSSLALCVYQASLSRHCCWD